MGLNGCEGARGGGRQSIAIAIVYRKNSRLWELPPASCVFRLASCIVRLAFCVLRPGTSKQSRNRPWRADVNSVREGAQSSSESSSAQTRRELDILLRDLANPSSHTITSGQPLATVSDNTMGIFYLFEPSVGETGRGISRTRQACITGALRPEPSLASTTTTSVTPLQLFCPYRLQRSFHRF